MNCKPGDLASFITPNNYGRQVSVERAATGGDDLIGWTAALFGPAWVVLPLQPLIATIRGSAHRKLHMGRCIVADSALRPITPPPGSECTDTPVDIGTPAESVA